VAYSLTRIGAVPVLTFFGGGLNKKETGGRDKRALTVSCLLNQGRTRKGSPRIVRAPLATTKVMGFGRGGITSHQAITLTIVISSLCSEGVGLVERLPPRETRRWTSADWQPPVLLVLGVQARARRRNVGRRGTALRARPLLCSLSWVRIAGMESVADTAFRRKVIGPGGGVPGFPVGDLHGGTHLADFRDRKMI